MFNVCCLSQVINRMKTPRIAYIVSLSEITENFWATKAHVLA